MGWDRSDTEGNLGSASAAFGLASMLVGERIPTYLAGIPWPQGRECRRLTLLTHAGRIPDPGGGGGRAGCRLRLKFSHFCRLKISHFERAVVPPDAVFGVSDLVEL